MSSKLGILLLLSILLTACRSKDDGGTKAEAHVTPTYVASMNPVDEGGFSHDVSENVIQGFAPFEGGWFTTQTSANKVLLINYLGGDGESKYHIRLDLDSHGQDLSLAKISDDELWLYTSNGPFINAKVTSLLRLKVQLAAKQNGVRDWDSTKVSIDEDFLLNYNHCTPTISEDKTKFAIRSKATVLVHDKQNIVAHNFDPLYHFALIPSQLKDNENRSMWFQGIAMKGGLVYCLTGNSTLTTEKRIYAYNTDGTVAKKYVFDKDDCGQAMDIKFEPEGLAFLNDELFFTIMTKSNSAEGNIKYLYKIKI